MNTKELLENLLKRENEEGWFEFKENWFDVDGLGEYISAISNYAKVINIEYGYLIWGVKDKNHKVVGTKFNYNRNIKGEPLEHYLIRNLHPKIDITFNKIKYKNKNIVILKIPCANKVPTSFKDVRYIRIGSSKESLLKYPEKEAALWFALNHGNVSIETLESEYQDLSFSSLFAYYGSKGIILNRKTFKHNLGLLTKDGKYNILAQLLSDDSHIRIRVAIFAGKEKSDPLYSVKEFGLMNLLNSLDKVIDYGDTFNIPLADERDRIVERKEIDLFDYESYREAVINAFVHNDWVNMNAPMFTIFSDRIEILSNGGLSPKLTIDDFYKGKSEPINKKLSDILLQLHISERTGRGVPTIVKTYGKEAFYISSNYIQVTIPFNNPNIVNYKIDNSIYESRIKDIRKINQSQIKIIGEMRNNPNITKIQLEKKLRLSHTAIQNNINSLQKNKYIKRIGSKKNGYWEVLK